MSQNTLVRELCQKIRNERRMKQSREKELGTGIIYKKKNKNKG